jgi:tRNA-Thr(GGU) m(6)t(6)A37 methyltransferase TsaA
MPAPQAPLSFSLRSIGVVRSPFLVAPGTPIQPAYAEGAEGRVILDEDCEAALQDLEGFERIWLLYWLDRVDGWSPRVVPYRDTREHGVLATRSPRRPNPLGLSVVRLLGREGRVLHVADLDVFDGTPLVDVKPYVPAFDAHPASRAGWFDTSAEERRVADERFHGADR